MALTCLGSVNRLCQEPIEWRIHDDGTLTEEDCVRLKSLGTVEIISRKQADEQIEPLLRNMPSCKSLRSELPLALKLLDTILLNPSDDYAFIDSDVLFLKTFKSPFRASDYRSKAVFMRDREQSYCLRSWGMATHPKIKLPSKLNSGIVIFHRPNFDLEFVEWFLTLPASQAISPMREQTAWALLGKQVDCEIMDESQVRVMRVGESESELVAGHFTAKTRPLLTKYAEASRRTDNSHSPATIRTKPCGTCAPMQLSWYELRRLWCKIFGK